MDLDFILLTQQTKQIKEIERFLNFGDIDSSFLESEFLYFIFGRDHCVLLLLFFFITIEARVSWKGKIEDLFHSSVFFFITFSPAWYDRRFSETYPFFAEVIIWKNQLSVVYWIVCIWKMQIFLIESFTPNTICILRVYKIYKIEKNYRYFLANHARAELVKSRLIIACDIIRKW